MSARMEQYTMPWLKRWIMTTCTNDSTLRTSLDAAAPLIFQTLLSCNLAPYIHNMNTTVIRLRYMSPQTQSLRTTG